MAGLQVYQRQDGQFGWRFVAGNNEIQAGDGGQGYRDATDAHRGFNDFVKNLLADLVETGTVQARATVDVNTEATEEALS